MLNEDDDFEITSKRLSKVFLINGIDAVKVSERNEQAIQISSDGIRHKIHGKIVFSLRKPTREIFLATSDVSKISVYPVALVVVGSGGTNELVGLFIVKDSKLTKIGEKTHIDSVIMVEVHGLRIIDRTERVCSNYCTPVDGFKGVCILVDRHVFERIGIQDFMLISDKPLT